MSNEKEIKILRRMENESTRLLDRIRARISEIKAPDGDCYSYQSRKRAAIKRASLDLNVECAKYRKGAYIYE